MFSLSKTAKSTLKTLVPIFGLSIASISFAGANEQAARLHTRITGVPPTSAVLKQMADLITANKAKEAAAIALQNPNFLNLTVFDMFAPFTNEDETNRVGLSDYVATAIGLIRDDANFKDALTADVIYTPPPVVGEAWSTDDNIMYENYQADFSDTMAAGLVKGTQTAMIKPALTVHDAAVAGFTDWAGLLTTREFAVGYYFDGTNRAALRFTGKTFICKDIDQLLDTTRADYRVRQDVSRQPAGNSTVFKTKCAGCHSGMDALAGAFAYFDATETENAAEELVDRYTISPGKPHSKNFNGADTFPAGYITKDDGWLNLWNEGPNKAIGWTGTQTGSGVKSYGALYAESAAFGTCMAKRVYSRTCLKDMDKLEGTPEITELAAKFKASGFNMKDLFAESAIKCMGN